MHSSTPLQYSLSGMDEVKLNSLEYWVLIYIPCLSVSYRAMCDLASSNFSHFPENETKAWESARGVWSRRGGFRIPQDLPGMSDVSVLMRKSHAVYRTPTELLLASELSVILCDCRKVLCFFFLQNYFVSPQRKYIPYVQRSFFLRTWSSGVLFIVIIVASHKNFLWLGWFVCLVWHLC